MYQSLQVVEPEVPAHEKTYHILANYLSLGKWNPVKPSSLRLKYLPNFVQTHEEWCKDVTSTYQARKKRTGKLLKKNCFTSHLLSHYQE